MFNPFLIFLSLSSESPRWPSLPLQLFLKNIIIKKRNKKENCKSELNMCGSRRDLRHWLCNEKGKKKTNNKRVNIFLFSLTYVRLCDAGHSPAGGLETATAAQAAHRRFLSLCHCQRVAVTWFILIVLYFYFISNLFIRPFVVFRIIVASRSWDRHYGNGF